MAVSPLADEFLISSVDWSAFPSDSKPTVAGHADGSFLVAWTSPYADEPEGSQYTEIYARAYSSSGEAGLPFVANSEIAGAQMQADAASRSDGSYVLTYVSGVGGAQAARIASQIFDVSGDWVGPEHFSPIANPWFSNPDVDVFADGSYVVVTNDHWQGVGFIHGSDGSLENSFSTGYTIAPRSLAVTTLGDDTFFPVWVGHDQIWLDPETASIRGIFGDSRSKEESLDVHLIAEPQGRLEPFSVPEIDPVAKTLKDGNVITVWTEESFDSTVGKEIYLIIHDFDAEERSSPINLTKGAVGDQQAADVAVLEDGRFVVVWEDETVPASGGITRNAIVGRVYNPDGTFDDNLFLAGSDLSSGQYDPAVTAIGNDFVVVWQSYDGVVGRAFDADALIVPDTYLLTRAGTRNASPTDDQTLVGPEFANSFYVDVNVSSGMDRLPDLANNDLLIINRRLEDPDGDRIVDIFEPGLDVDGDGPLGDRLAIGSTDTLRFLGARTASKGETVYLYSPWSVLSSDVGGVSTPAQEGILGNDVLKGTATKDLFYFNTALKAALGSDVIRDFGPGDRIVTSTALADPNGDGAIRLNSSDRLLFDTPAEDGPSSLKVFNTSGKALSTLILDDVVNGYYFYAAAGDTVSGPDVW